MQPLVPGYTKEKDHHMNELKPVSVKEAFSMQKDWPTTKHYGIVTSTEDRNALDKVRIQLGFPDIEQKRAGDFFVFNDKNLAEQTREKHNQKWSKEFNNGIPVSGGSSHTVSFIAMAKLLLCSKETLEDKTKNITDEKELNKLRQCTFGYSSYLNSAGHHSVAEVIKAVKSFGIDCDFRHLPQKLLESQACKSLLEVNPDYLQKDNQELRSTMRKTA